MNTRPNPPDFDGETPVPGLDLLARERLPTRDLWPGVEARLQPRGRRLAPWSYGLAASLAVASVVGFLLRTPDSPAPAPVMEVASADANARSSGWEAGSEAQAGRQPRQFRTLRSESWNDLPAPVSQAGFDDSLVSVGYRANGRFAARASKAGGSQHRTLLRANLKLVSQAERELRRALREDPQSQSLQDLLAAAEAQRQSLQGLISTEQD